MAKSKRAPKRKLPPQPLSTAEIRKMLGACPRDSAYGLRTMALITLLWRSGLRVGEALALRPGDLDAEKGTVSVLHGKGDKHRRVGMDRLGFRAVAMWLERRRAWRVPAFAPLFCTSKGKQVDPSSVRRSFRRAARRCGLGKRVHPHGFRHTLATELVREGTGIVQIQGQLGHSDIRTTAIYLASIQPQEVIDAMRCREAPKEIAL